MVDRVLGRVPGALALALLVFGGCVLELDEPPVPVPLSFCAQNFECGQGEVCEEGYCVVQTEVRELVSVQISPPNSLSVVAEQFPTVELEQGSQMPALQFQRPKLLSGTVSIRGTTFALCNEAQDIFCPFPDNFCSPMGACGRLIGANLILERKTPVIEGLNPIYQVEANSEDGFTVQLPSGVYDITVLPTGTDIPPERLENVVIRADSQQNIVLERQTEAVALTGRVVHTHTNTEELVPIKDVRLSAVDDRDIRVSTIATSDEDGFFRLLVRSNARSVRLIATPIERELLSLPRYQGEVLLLNGREVEIGNVNLGKIDPVGRLVQGNLIAADDGTPVRDATLIFRGQIGDGDLVRSTVTRIDEDNPGRFDIQLAAGDYTVQVLPSEREPFAITEFPILTVPVSGDPSPVFQNLRVQRRTLVRGQALSPDGQARLDGATVQLKRIQVAGSVTFDGPRTFSVRADEQGFYETLVDPGIYDVTIVPPNNAGHARAFIFGEQIGGDVFELDLIASRGNLARGDVISPDGDPLGDILVEIYRKDPERGPILMGSGRTDPQGRYRLLVPALRRQ